MHVQADTNNQRGRDRRSCVSMTSETQPQISLVGNRLSAAEGRSVLVLSLSRLSRSMPFFPGLLLLLAPARLPPHFWGVYVCVCVCTCV